MKSIIFITTLALTCGFCFGQNDSADNLSADDAQAKSHLTLATVYSNNASYYGQRAEGQTPYIALAANYQLKSGIYFTGQSYKILNDKTSTVSASSLGAGVNFKLGNKLSTDVSYSHSFYPAYSPLLQAANADNASLVFSYEGWLKTSITGDYAFGKTTDEFVTAAISKSINLFSIGKKDIVIISPSADVVAGTQHYYQTYLVEKKLRDSLFGVLTDPLFGNSSSGTTTTKSIATFNLLTYNLKCPIAYNRAHYLIEATYQYSILDSHAHASGIGKSNSFLTFSFYYQF